LWGDRLDLHQLQGGHSARPICFGLDHTFVRRACRAVGLGADRSPAGHAIHGHSDGDSNQEPTAQKAELCPFSYRK
jgi:hypothetical protein